MSQNERLARIEEGVKNISKSLVEFKKEINEPVKNNSKDIAVMKTKLSVIIWIFGVIVTASVSALAWGFFAK